MIIFYTWVGLTTAVGLYFYRNGKGAYAFAFFSVFFFLIALVAIISFISLYFYELPTHHCPFDLLQKEYHYIGYPLYISLFVGGILGTGVGVLQVFRKKPSLRHLLPKIQRRLCAVSVVAHLFFTAISTYPMIFSDFKLLGY
jgi:hypothetical protein